MGMKDKTPGANISQCPICGNDLETSIYDDGIMSIRCESGKRCIVLASKDHAKLFDLLQNTDWRRIVEEVKFCPQCGGDGVEIWFDDKKFFIHCAHPSCWARVVARGETLEEALAQWKEIVRTEEKTEKEEIMNYKLFSPHCEPEFHGDWIDLKTRTDIEFHTGDLKKIPLGIAIQLPEGHEAMLTLRSSTPLRYGIMQANAPGIIDEKYCGDEDEIQLLAYAFRSGTIPAGTRVAQMRIFRKQGDLNLVEVKSLGNANRGGFGSTGK